MNLFSCEGQGPEALAFGSGCTAFGFLYLGKHIAESDDFMLLGILDLKKNLVPFNEGIEYTGLGLLGAGGVADRLSKNHSSYPP